jgi:hypothetical protein
MNILKKKPIVHAAKMITRILRRRFGKIIEDVLGED